jgi:hypothetical protein
VNVTPEVRAAINGNADVPKAASDRLERDWPAQSLDMAQINSKPEQPDV